MQQKSALDPKRLSSLREEILSRIKFLMESKGVLQKHLAVMIGREPSYVSLLLVGKVNFSFQIITDIEHALGEKIIEVVEAEEAEKKHRQKK